MKKVMGRDKQENNQRTLEDWQQEMTGRVKNRGKRVSK